MEKQIRKIVCTLSSDRYRTLEFGSPEFTREMRMFDFRRVAVALCGAAVGLVAGLVVGGDVLQSTVGGFGLGVIVVISSDFLYGKFYKQQGNPLNP